MRYRYEIKTLVDARKRDQVFVPNASAREAVEVWRYLSGLRKDFPKYHDHSLLVVGIDEDAWCSPQVYREAFCPLDMICIVRLKNASKGQ